MRADAGADEKGPEHNNSKRKSILPPLPSAWTAAGATPDNTVARGSMMNGETCRVRKTGAPECRIRLPGQSSTMRSQLHYNRQLLL
ncbi:hypothetical protein KCP76_20400 [Salmonella enterica subsp. enterica serovar Weltevreden]|nr:hypothetical protein KCP76_20400 [Salmonella enterica subsp. enterica serovar Weltevreden]